MMVVQEVVVVVVAILLLEVVVLVRADRVHPRHCGGSVRHVHLAVGRDPSSEMTVSFASIPSRYDEAPVGGVLVGTSPTRLTDLFIERETASSYNHRVATDQQANYGDEYYSPYYHHVEITGLQPSTTYYYRPAAHATVKGFEKYHYVRRRDPLRDHEESSENGEVVEDEELDRRRRRRRRLPSPYDGSDRDCPSADKIRSFRTGPPRSGSDDDDDAVAAVSFAVVGDLGQFPHSEDTASSLLLRSQYDMDAIILAGDIAYTGTDHRRWDTFFDFMDDYPFAERVPVQICPGNHDIDKAPDSRELFTAYERRFRMPRVRRAELGLFDGPEGPLNLDHPHYPLPYEWGNAYYSFAYGPAKVIMINAYSSMEPNSTQYNWILDELSNRVDRDATPWLIAVLHTPIYNTFALHLRDPQIIAAKRHLEPMFVQHQVNVVFSGHIHAYLRTANVAMDRLDPKGPVHVTIGAGGRQCEAPFRNAQPEPWVEVRDATIFGYGMFRIFNRTTARWDWVHTGLSDKHDTNQIWKSNRTLPSGPGRDQVFIQNQYYL